MRDDLHDERDERAVAADPYAPPEDSALLDDPWVVREEHDDYWDSDSGDPDDGTDAGTQGGGPARA